jgi:hypothetical protein
LAAECWQAKGAGVPLRLQRWIGITGIIFVVLLVASVLVTPGNNPNTNATATKIVDYYHKHKNGYIVGGWLTVAAVFIGVPYFWYLREYMANENEENRRLATVAFLGVFLFALSGAIAAGMNFTLVDHVGKINPVMTQTLNDLNGTLWSALTGIGVGLFLLATGIAIVRNHTFATWIGWAAVVFAVASITVILGMLGVALFVLVSSIVIIRRTGSATATPTAGGSPQAGSQTSRPSV